MRRRPLAWHWLPPGGYLKSPVAEPRQLLYYREGNNATVSVVEEAGGTRTILVDGQPVAGTVADQRRRSEDAGPPAAAAATRRRSGP